MHCGICFEEFQPQDMCAAACKHYFCKDCWKGYISNGIREGPSVLGLRCPIPDCGMAVSSMPHWLRPPIALLNSFDIGQAHWPAVVFLAINPLTPQK